MEAITFLGKPTPDLWVQKGFQQHASRSPKTPDAPQKLRTQQPTTFLFTSGNSMYILSLPAHAEHLITHSFCKSGLEPARKEAQASQVPRDKRSSNSSMIEQNKRRPALQQLQGQACTFRQRGNDCYGKTDNMVRSPGLFFCSLY